MITVCYSFCGTWISLRNTTNYLKYVGPWTMEPECLGSVAPLRMPRAIFPQRAITSVLWGSHEVSLHSANRNGRFELLITDVRFPNSMILINQLLPKYLTNVTPVVILDNEHCSSIRLVFLCQDRAPETMTLPETWNQIYSRCQWATDMKRNRLMEKYGSGLEDSINATADSFSYMTSVQERYYSLTGVVEKLKQFGEDQRCQNI